VALRTGLDGYEKSRPHWDSIPGPSSPNAIQAPVGGLLGDFPKQLRKATIKLMMFIRISAWNSTTATGEIFVRFLVRTLY